MKALKLFVAGMTVASGLVQATILDATTQGRYTSGGDNNPTSGNYIAGQMELAGVGTFTFRNYFVFNLASLSGFGPATSAALQLFQPGTGSSGGFANGYSSADATETYKIYDVSSNISQLISSQTSNTSIYNDLGSGVEYGSITVGQSSNGTTLDIIFNSTGLAAINALLASAGDKTLAIGGALTSLLGTGNQYLFGNTHLPQFNNLQKLNLTFGNEPPLSGVPEPGTLVTFGIAAVILKRSLQRRKARVR